MRRHLKLVFFSVMLISSTVAFAQGDAYSIKHYNLKKGLAIQGYDPVAYFTENKAVEGSKELAYSHNDITYYFSSDANRKKFIASPEKYEPEYGGYCAYAMADGDKVRIDPETFKILDGKLYLFYNFRFTNTLKSWNKDENNLLNKANGAWTKIISGN